MVPPNSGQCSSVSVKEAQSLVRRCAEPRTAGESVKAAIRRVCRRLDLPFTRTRDIWYGDARRIDAGEMDRLRREALNAEFVAGIDALKALSALRVTHSHPMFAELRAALRLLHSRVNASCTGLVKTPSIHDMHEN
jgi:hypothetical protein